MQLNHQITGSDNGNVGISLNNLAILYRQTGRYKRAEIAQRKALAVDQKALGADHPVTVINTLVLSQVLRVEKQYRKPRGWRAPDWPRRRGFLVPSVRIIRHWISRSRGSVTSWSKPIAVPRPSRCTARRWSTSSGIWGPSIRVWRHRAQSGEDVSGHRP